jgi:hypothetical protein
VDVHLLKLQRLQNRVLRAAGNLDRRTLVREMQVALKIPYVYDYITKLCRTQSEVIPNHVNSNVYGSGPGEGMYRKYKRIKLGGGLAYDQSADQLQFQSGCIS